MNARVININLQQGYKKTIILGLSQYDAGVPLQFNVYDGAGAASFASGTTVTLQGRRPSGVGFMLNGVLSDNIATFTSATDLTGEAGTFPAELRFETSGIDVGTVNLMIQIERAPHPDGTVDADITRQQTVVERLDAIEEWIAQASGHGLSDDAKQALLQIAQKVAYIDEHGQDYYDALYDALYPPAPPVTLLSISAVYTQSGVVYDTDSLDILRDDLVVTATYDDSSTSIVTTYTLSGTLAEGSSTITVSYGGKTTTFTVTVTHNSKILLNSWDFRQSLTDSVGGITAVLTHQGSQPDATRDSSGLTFSNYGASCDLGEVFGTDRTIEIDFGACNLVSTTSHTRAFMVGTAPDTGNGIVLRTGNNWTAYGGTWWNGSFSIPSEEKLTYFANKTISLYIDEDGYIEMSANGTSLGKAGVAFTGSNLHFYISSKTTNTGGANFYTATITGLRVYSGGGE